MTTTKVGLAVLMHAEQAENLIAILGLQRREFRRAIAEAKAAGDAITVALTAPLVEAADDLINHFAAALAQSRRVGANLDKIEEQLAAVARPQAPGRPVN